MSFVTYAGLRGDPKFAELLADYDRVSELLGDAQHDIGATTAERDALLATIDRMSIEHSNERYRDEVRQENRRLHLRLTDKHRWAARWKALAKRLRDERDDAEDKQGRAMRVVGGQTVANDQLRTERDALAAALAQVKALVGELADAIEESDRMLLVDCDIAPPLDHVALLARAREAVKG